MEAARDTFSQNDRADSNTIVKGEPRILVLAGDEKVAAELVTALETEGQNVDSIIPEALPTDFAGLATYDSIVVVDVPRIRLSDRQLAALQVYVRDLGRGLVMVGGPAELRRGRLCEDADGGAIRGAALYWCAVQRIAPPSASSHSRPRRSSAARRPSRDPGLGP